MELLPEEPEKAKKKIVKKEKKKKIETLPEPEESKFEDEPAIEIREEPKVDPMILAQQIREE